ncbi:TniQ family protein [uncultured Oxalicibacterium sp.]|uniref:TniQ family protein n=1 Tax=uncultured Oxalicibacterium sp. TaxID=1168540 RepID=UPI0025D019A1|nr:TniQ family protein [uncultured Oxalicibacterium sp.]
MRNSYRTYFRIDSQMGESLRGYTLRLAEYNGFAKATWISEVPNEIERIVELYGSRLFGKTPGFIKLGKESFVNQHPTYQSATSAFTYCPVCISTIDYIPFYWENKFYTACHKHGCFMQSTCDACGRTVGWESRGTMRRCDCGCELGGSTPKLASQMEVLLCWSLATALCKEYECELLVREPCPEMIFAPDSVPLLIKIMGETVLPRGSGGQPGLDILGSGGLSKASLMTSRTAWFLDDWPNNFRKFLHDNQAYFDETQSSQYDAGVYERFAKRLIKESKNSKIDFLLREYRDFALNNWPKVLTRRNTWVPDAELDEQAHVLLPTAAKVLQVTQAAVKKLVRDNMLKGSIKKTASGREFYIVCRKSLFELKTMSSEDITERAARDFLGVSKGVVNKLVNAGHLTVYGQSLLFGEKSGHRTFHRNQIFDTLNRIYSYGRQPDKDDECLSYAKACKNILTTAEAERFMFDVVNLSIPILKTLPFKKWNLKKAFFMKSEVTDWLHKQRNEKYLDYLSVQELAERLSVKEEVAYFLVRQGLIASKSVVIGRRRCLKVSEHSVRKFAKQYITAVNLAVLMNTSSAGLVYRMRDNGVLPKIGPPTDKCRQVFYQRDEVAAVLREDFDTLAKC